MDDTQTAATGLRRARGGTTGEAHHCTARPCLDEARSHMLQPRGRTPQVLAGHEGVAASVWAKCCGGRPGIGGLGALPSRMVTRQAA
jgi:hypothetical protein